MLTGALMLTVVSAFAQTPLWLRDVAVSPDGCTIAFTYRGDIYTVPFAGGQARLAAHAVAQHKAQHHSRADAGRAHGQVQFLIQRHTREA